MENPVKELKVSQLGSKISYIPLETNDSSLLPDRFDLRATDKYILAVVMDEWGFGKTACLSFDIKDGKFVASVGHRGDDPEAYYSSFPMPSADGSTLYFSKWATEGAWLVNYTPTGEYLGDCHPGAYLQNSSLMTDTTIVTALAGIDKTGHFSFSLVTCGLNSPADTMVYIPEKPKDPNDDGVYRDVAFGTVRAVMRNATTKYTHMIYVTEKRNEYLPNAASNTFWKVGNEMHLKPLFVDTLYHIAPGKIEKAYVFATGDKGVNYSTMNEKTIRQEDLLLADVIENKDFIIYGASIGWFGSRDYKSKRFIGLYNKATGENTAAPWENAFVDDIRGFMPFNPIFATPDGTLIGVLTMDDISNYIEEHPEVTVPEEIAALPEDANPVCVVVTK